MSAVLGKTRPLTGVLAIGLVMFQGADCSAQEEERIKKLEQRLENMQEAWLLERGLLDLELEQLNEEITGLRSLGQAPQSISIFNPQITVFGNLLGRHDDRDVFLDDDDEEPRVDAPFHLREVEVDFRAPIDPFADARGDRSL